MFCPPSGNEQACAMTYLLSYMIHRVRQIQITYHSRNPCGEILLREKFDLHIYQRQVEIWVGEPGFITPSIPSNEG